MKENKNPVTVEQLQQQQQQQSGSDRNPVPKGGAKKKRKFNLKKGKPLGKTR